MLRDLANCYVLRRPERWTQYMPDGTGTGDLRLHLCVEPWRVVAPIVGPLQTTRLVAVQKTYKTNLDRVHAFTVFAPAIVNTTKILTELRDEIFVQHRDAIVAKKISDVEVAALIEHRIADHANARERTLAGGGKPAQDLLQNELKFGFEAMDSFLKGELASAAHAWMSAQITGIWTAFEALAEELWVAALNEHPRILAELRGAKKAAGEDKKEDKKVDLYLLQMHNYDLSSKMGEILQKRYSFDRLEDIRQAYIDAFSEDADTIKDAVNDRALDALALTRHVIIHNGGIIDVDYLKRRNDLPPAILRGIGDPLPLDGDITASLITPVMQLGWNLLTEVDRWIATH